MYVVKEIGSTWEQTTPPSSIEPYERTLPSLTVRQAAFLSIRRRDWICLSFVVPYLTSWSFVSTNRLYSQTPFYSTLYSRGEMCNSLIVLDGSCVSVDAYL